MQLKQIITLTLYLLYIGASHAKPDIDIKWLGGPTMQISFNGVTFLTDPMLGEGEKAFVMGDPNEPFDLNEGPNIKHHARLTPLPKIDLSDINFVLLSHAHEDHFDQTAHKKLDKNLKLILPIADENKVRQLGFTQLNTLRPDEAIDIKAGDGWITLTAVPADHSNNPALTPLLGEGLGYLMQFKLGRWQKTIYWTGDTMPTKRVITAVKRIGTVDVLIPNMGAVGTPGPLGQISMGATDVMLLAKALSVKNILPVHHSTYALYLEPIEKLQQATQNQSAELIILKEGNTQSYPLHRSN